MATNPIPMSLITFNVYDSNSERQLGIAKVQLPTLTMATTDVKGSGIMGTMSWPIFGQFDNMEMTMTFRVLYEGSTRFMVPNAHSFTLRSAYEKYDAADGTRNMHGLKIFVRGLTAEQNLGSLETGEDSEVTVKIHIDYIKIEDSKDGLILEFDRFNYIWNTSEDLIADLREALGY